MFSVTHTIQHSLEIVAHRSEFISSDIEGVIHGHNVEDRTKVDCFAQVFDIQQLIEIVSGSKDREVPALISPGEKQFKHTQPLGSDETLWP
jgi:hypothetical protein